VVGTPLNFSGIEDRIRRPTADAGEHTEAVLAELGYDTEAIAALRAGGVI
jgi:formyl-CoA transferase